MSTRASVGKRFLPRVWRARSDEAERGVCLDLARLDAAGVLAAPHVVGHTDRVEARGLSRFSSVGQCFAQSFGPAAPVCRGDVQAELHRGSAFDGGAALSGGWAMGL